MEFEEQPIFTYFGPVVQLVRTPACHAGGRQFESVRGRISQGDAVVSKSAPYTDSRWFESSPCNQQLLILFISYFTSLHQKP